MIDQEKEPQILIVEDEAIIAMRIERLLTGLGYAVAGMVPTGERALRHIEDQPPDLVLMDVKLGGEWDGIEAATRVRERFDVPIIYLTADPERMVRADAKHTQPYGFLSKPVRDPELRAAVEMALYKHRMEAQLRESEDRYRRLTENSPDMIYRMSLPDGEYEYVSSAATAISGYPPETWYNNPLFIREILVPDWLPYFETAWDRLLKGDVPPTYEYSIVHKDGRIRWLNQRNVVVTDDDGRPVAIEGIVTNVTERKQAEQALRESEERFRLIAETSSDMIFRLDLEGRVTYCSPSVERVLGLTPDEVVGTHLRRYFPETGLPQAMQNFQRAAAAEQVEIIDTEIVNHAGKLIPVEATLVPIIRDGQVVGIQGAARDVSERKGIEKAVAEERERLDTILSTLDTGLSLINPNMTIAWVNRKIHQMFPEGDPVDQVCHVFYESLNRPCENCGTLKAFETGEVQMRERFNHVNERWYAIISQPVKDDQGEVIQVLEGVTDITERKQAEEALRDSEAHYRSLFSNNHAVMLLIDPTTGAIEDANPAACAYYGYVHDVLTGMTIAEINVLSFDQVHQEMQRAKQEERNHFFFRHRLASGEVRDVEVYSGPIQVSGQQLLYSIIHDITERKQAEEALHRQHVFLETLLEAIPAPIFYKDMDGRYTGCNEAFEALIGRDRREIIGKTVYDMGPSDIADRYAEKDEELFREPGWQRYEWQVHDGDGQIRHVVFNKASIIGPNDEPVGLIGVIMDITERKQAKEALRRSLIDLRLAQEIAEIGNWQFDPAIGVPVWSEQVYKIYERDPQLGPPHIDEYQRMYEADQFGIFNTAIQWAIREGEPYDITLRLKLPSGVKWIHAICQPEDEKGPAGHFLRGTIQDITKQKRIEMALRESEELNRAMIDSSKDCIKLLDLDGNLQFMSAGGQELLEIEDIDSLLGDSWVDFWKDDDREQVQSAIDQALEGGSGYFEGYCPTLNGTPKWWSVLISPIFDAEGNVDQLLSISRDITERKREEETLRQYAERIHILHDIDAAILQAQSPEEIAIATLKRLHHLFLCPRISISEIDPVQQQGHDTIVLVDGELRANGSDWYPLSYAGRQLIETIRGERSHVIRDITTLETRSPLEQTLDTAGLRAYVSVPLLVQGALAGTLNLASGDPNFFQPGHVEILEEIAASLAVALQQARLLEQTRRDAESKARLLREVNHRVMNNLTMIMGILDMEQRHSPDDEAADFQAMLRDVTSRIDGMVTVHRMLSDVQWMPLDLNEVVTRVIGAALGHSPIQSYVDVVVDAPDDPPHVTSGQAISVALIVNELTTNSVKYAFRDRPQGKIQVQIIVLEEEEGRGYVRLVYRDDGPGMPAAVLAGEGQNTGLWLVKANATHDLDGAIELANDGGAVVTVTFPRVPLD